MTFGDDVFLRTYVFLINPQCTAKCLAVLLLGRYFTPVTLKSTLFFLDIHLKVFCSR